MSEHKWLTEEQVNTAEKDIEKWGKALVWSRSLRLAFIADRREMRKLLDRVTATDIGEADSVWQDINDMLEATADE